MKNELNSSPRCIGLTALKSPPQCTTEAVTQALPELTHTNDQEEPQEQEDCHTGPEQRWALSAATPLLWSCSTSLPGEVSRRALLHTEAREGQLSIRNSRYHCSADNYRAIPGLCISTGLASCSKQGRTQLTSISSSTEAPSPQPIKYQVSSCCF